MCYILYVDHQVQSGENNYYSQDGLGFIEQAYLSTFVRHSLLDNKYSPVKLAPYLYCFFTYMDWEFRRCRRHFHFTGEGELYTISIAFSLLLPLFFALRLFTRAFTQLGLNVQFAILAKFIEYIDIFTDSVISSKNRNHFPSEKSF